MTTTTGIPEHLELTAKLDLQAAAGDKSPPKFSLVANTGQPMDLPGFMDAVIIDLNGAKFDRDPTPVIADHDTTKRIGHTTAQRINADGIHAEGVVSSSMGIAQGFVKDAKAGFPFQVSVGASIQDGSFLPEGETATVNGKQWTGPLIIARKTSIRELSVTVLGADSATAAIVAAANKNHQPKGMDTMPTTDTKPQDAIAIERNRINAINDMMTPPADGWGSVQDNANQLRASAINGEVPLADIPGRVRDLAELKAMREERPNHGQRVPAGHVRGTETNPSIIEAGLALYVGVPNIESQYDERTLDAANRLPINSMLDLCRIVATAEGKPFQTRNADSVIKAAFSTTVFSDLLSNVANKSLEDAYKAFPSAARIIAKKLTANDFKQHTGVRLTGDTIFEKVGAQGELKHGLLTDSSFNYQIDTYGKTFGLDRQALRNDDLSALDEIPRMLGRGAALAIEEVFWTLVLANTGSFFSVGNNNLLTGAGSDLDAASLGDAVQLFLEQTDAEGKPIGVTPRFLCVPPALKTTADELFVSRTLNVGGGSATADDRLPGENVLFGKYQPLVSPWLGANGGLSGGTDTQWYLFGDNRDVAAFGIAYLDGNEKPVIETKEQDPSKLGIIFRGYTDFGVCQIDNKGSVKSDGA